MKKVFCAILVVLMIASIVYAQEETLLPPDLTLITPSNIDKVQEIALLGNGGSGKLYWSPDGKTLAVANSAGVWLHNAQLLSEEPRYIPESNIDGLHFSDNSLFLVLWQNTKPADLWEVASGDQVTDWNIEELSENQNWRYQVKISEAGAPMNQHTNTTIMDILTGTSLYSYQADLSDLHFSADRSLVALGERINQVFYIDTGEPLQTYDGFPNSTGEIQLLSSSGDLVLLGSTYSDAPLGLYRTADGEPIQTLWGSEGQKRFIGFTSDDDYIVARDSSNNHILVWSTETGSLVNTFQISEHLTDYFYQHWTLIDAHQLMIGSPETGYLAIYNLISGQEIMHLESDLPLFDYAYSPNGCCIATLSLSGILTIWNSASGEELSQVDYYEDFGEVKAISPDGHTLITVVPDYNIAGIRSSNLFMIDTQSGQVIDKIEQSFSAYPVVVYSPDGRQFASNAMGPYSLEWQLWTWNMPGLRNAWDISYSSDSRYLAIVAGTNDVYGVQPPIYLTLSIYDSQSEGPLVSVPEFRANSGGFSAVAFSPDNRYIVANQEYPRVWEVDKLLNGDQTPLAILESEDSISDLAFSPDGQQLIAGRALLRTGGDGFAQLHGSCSAIVWDFADVLKRAYAGQSNIDNHECYGFVDYSGPYRFVSFNSNGDMILVYGNDDAWQGGDGASMTLLDSSNVEVLRNFSDQRSFVISPDSKFMISEGKDKRLHYWGILSHP